MTQKHNKFAVGIFVDGLEVYHVRMNKYNDVFRITQLQSFTLNEAEIPADTLELATATPPAIEADLDLDDIDLSEELKSNSVQEEIEVTVDEEGEQDNSLYISRMFSDYKTYKYKAGVSLTEPDIFYLDFEPEFDLKGKKLQNRIMEEVAKVKGDAKKIRSNDYDVIELSEDKFTILINNQEVEFLKTLGTLKHRSHSDFPSVGFVESVEFSIANIVNYNFDFEEDETTVLINTADESSRILFFLGKKLIHISQLISDGVRSRKIANIIYSRLLFEMDSLNIGGIDRIVLCGKIKPRIQSLMEESFSDEAKIELIDFTNFDLSELEPDDIKRLPEFSAAIGAAYRILNPDSENIIKTDITPLEIIAGQKTFKFGMPGWIFLGVITITVLIGAVKVADLINRHNSLRWQITQKTLDIIEFESLIQQFEAMQNLLVTSESTLTSLNKLTVGSKAYSTFLKKLFDDIGIIGDIWLTDIISLNDGSLQIIGNSLYRNRITSLTEKTTTAQLLKVDAIEIREKQIYNFIILVTLSPN